MLDTNDIAKFYSSTRGGRVSRGTSRNNFAVCTCCGASTRAKQSGYTYKHATGDVKGAPACPGGRAVLPEWVGRKDGERELAELVTAARRGLAALFNLHALAVAS